MAVRPIDTGPGSRRLLDGSAEVKKMSFWFGVSTPPKLAHLSVKGARLAFALVSAQCAIALVSVQGAIARGFVDASLVGSGIGDADTGIVGVCLCWWNADGRQCYRRCRRHAHYCPLHQFFLS